MYGGLATHRPDLLEREFLEINTEVDELLGLLAVYRHGTLSTQVVIYGDVSPRTVMTLRMIRKRRRLRYRWRALVCDAKSGV